ncbi:hypothetical protein EVAR_44630_1 [Eumeta japonica]|uniref:Uncharacterized protein n=1 Tax=Eumeta variegata TaxID=151549 RepID=A0A4C1YVS9_EUMVA|nr:hypothetical protein EVAR_44630_1 [Eumeta japonica]
MLSKSDPDVVVTFATAALAVPSPHKAGMEGLRFKPLHQKQKIKGGFSAVLESRACLRKDASHFCVYSLDPPFQSHEHFLVGQWTYMEQTLFLSVCTLTATSATSVFP